MESNPCAAVRLRENKKVGTKQIKHFTYKQAKTFLEALDKPLVMKTAAHNRIDDTGKPYHVPGYLEESWVSSFTSYLIWHYLVVAGGKNFWPLHGKTLILTRVLSTLIKRHIE